MGTKEDLQGLKYRYYIYNNGQLTQTLTPKISNDIFNYQWHHFIPQNIKKRNMQQYKELEHLQKLFFVPTQLHLDLHNHIRNFEQKWGIAPEELLYNYRDKLKENEIS